MFSIRTIRQWLAVAVIAMLAAAPVAALELSQAKDNGSVGETSSGYLAAVKPSAEVNALVESINAQRKAHYQKIAKENGIALDAVEMRAGKKAIEKSSPGAYINTGDGWRQK
ncbi:MAG: YdbL family protein [Gammaproteobacteria bacterium]|nr:YdbL family protein [Gammaproteobacteria bacterium]